MPIWYPVPSALDFLVGFLDVRRHLASMVFFVGCYLAVDQHIGTNCKLSFLDLEIIGSVSLIFGQHLSFYSVHPICNILGDLGSGLKCDWVPISKAQDAHLETLTFTSALNSDLEFRFRIFLVDLFN
ncbi:hypothetical protein C1646_756237 [Rhizophagus diaphanus]|nr:hypothetical protein C1646_756237 [Rhizophagus diaphanus] [Rhizophagus sp. MUCL 43196]